MAWRERVDMMSYDLVITSAQCFSATVIAALLLYYERIFRNVSLRLWAGSFAAMAVYAVLSELALGLSYGPGAESWSRLTLSAASQIAAYWQLALAVMATMLFLRPGSPGPRRRRQVLWLAALLGAGLALVWAHQADAAFQRMLMRGGVRYVAGITCFAWIAVMLWRSKPRDGLGTRITAAAMAIYSLQLLHVFILYIWQVYTRQVIE